jgi:hypothetical protein
MGRQVDLTHHEIGHAVENVVLAVDVVLQRCGLSPELVQLVASEARLVEDLYPDTAAGVVVQVRPGRIRCWDFADDVAALDGSAYDRNTR